MNYLRIVFCVLLKTVTIANFISSICALQRGGTTGQVGVLAGFVIAFWSISIVLTFFEIMSVYESRYDLIGEVAPNQRLPDVTFMTGSILVLNALVVILDTARAEQSQDKLVQLLRTITNSTHF